MSRRHDAPWVVLGMPEKNKLLLSQADEKRVGRYETLICERKPGTEEPEFVYMRLMWCTREAVQAFRDHLDRLLEMWEEEHGTNLGDFNWWLCRECGYNWPTPTVDGAVDEVERARQKD